MTPFVTSYPYPAKVTVNLPVELVEQMKAMARWRGTTFTQCMKEAMAFYMWVQTEKDRGNQLLIERGGEIREVLTW